MTTEYIDETTKPAPAAIQSIYLTKTSVKPIWLAGSILLALVGLFALWPLMVIAAVVAVAITLSWIGESRDESDELPLN